MSRWQAHIYDDEGENCIETFISESGAHVAIGITDGEEVALIHLIPEKIDALIRCLSLLRVEIKPPTPLYKSPRKYRQPNVPDNADALARVAMSKPERIDGGGE